MCLQKSLQHSVRVTWRSFLRFAVKTRFNLWTASCLCIRRGSIDSERLSLATSQIGKLQRVACQFSFMGGEEFAKGNIRVNSELEPFGCLGDLGWYCIRFILWTNQYAMPTRVSGRTLSTLQGDGSQNKVPAEFSGELDFPKRLHS